MAGETIVPAIGLSVMERNGNGSGLHPFTTFARTRLPMTVSPSLIDPIRRRSIRTDAWYLSARPPGVVSGFPNITPILKRVWLM